MDETYNIYKLVPILSDHSRALQWLRDIGLIPATRYCRKHKRMMKLNEGVLGCGQFRCQKSSKYSHVSTVAENTWFERCHISPESCMLITYCFANHFSFKQTMRESSIVEGKTVSTETVADRFSYCREVCMLALGECYKEEGQIGGVGETIEIGECKIGRRKYTRGRIAEGHWILAMIHRGHRENYRIEICPDDESGKETHLALIRKHIKPGSMIHTYCWTGYVDLNLHGYIHVSGNHSVTFVDPENEGHTTNIESAWGSMRRELLRTGVSENTLADHMCEIMWRRRTEYLGREPFTELIKAIKFCYPGV